MDGATVFFVASILTLVSAALRLGPADRQAQRFLRDLEQRLAANQSIAWCDLRPVLRSSTSADDRLSAVAGLIGRTQIDGELFSAFERADYWLRLLERRYRDRYYTVLFYAAWILVVLVLHRSLPDGFSVQVFALRLDRTSCLLALFLAPLLGLLVLLLRVGAVENRLNNAYAALEELL